MLYTYMHALFIKIQSRKWHSAIAIAFKQFCHQFSFTIFTKHSRAADGGKSAVIKVRKMSRNYGHDLFYMIYFTLKYDFNSKQWI
jgi:hypothetical protein